MLYYACLLTQAEVKAVFGSGKTKVAGCVVTEGKLQRAFVTVRRGKQVRWSASVTHVVSCQQLLQALLTQKHRARCAFPTRLRNAFNQFWRMEREQERASALCLAHCFIFARCVAHSLSSRIGAHSNTAQVHGMAGTSLPHPP